MYSEKIKVLVVDYNPQYRNLISHLLSQNPLLHCVTEEVERGTQAIEQLRKKSYDLIILGNLLLDPAGLEVLLESKRNPLLKNTPVVVLLDENNEHLADVIRNYGVFDFLYKNQINADTLNTIVRAAINYNRSTINVRQIDYDKLLINEIHHRFYGVLNIIKAILKQQLLTLSADIDPKQVLQDTINRIQSISEIHRLIYGQLEKSDEVDMQLYLPGLAGNLLEAFRTANQIITLQSAIEPIVLQPKVAFKIGLILSEVIVNAFKYAFINAEKGTFWIGLTRLESNELHQIYELKLKDRVIIPQYRPQSELAGTGLGTQLIRMFVQDLNGQLSLVVGDEYDYTIVF